MRIVYIAAGSGDMYCGACARDIVLINGLMARGHDVQVVPLYTPPRTQLDDKLPSAPIFYGGINAYLTNISRVFRHMPDRLREKLDSPKLLKLASRFAIKTRPQELGSLTVSVLAGENGSLKAELDRLVNFLQAGDRPDVINITNSLLSGIAPQLKKRLGVPVLCNLQGEESFVDAIPEPYASDARRLIRANAAHIDLFISPGERYATTMANYLRVTNDKIRVIRTGIDTNTFKPSSLLVRKPFTIGYLSVINPTKGLDLLVDAFSLLVSEPGRDIRLRVAGKVLRPDYWGKIERKIHLNGLGAKMEYVGEVDHPAKIEFLRNCSVFSVPSRINESRGIAMMEAIACGVPVVAPMSGVYPEMINLTGGGLLFAPEDVNSLACALSRLMDNPAHANTISRTAPAGIARYYSADNMANEVIKVYEEISGTKPEERVGEVITTSFRS